MIAQRLHSFLGILLGLALANSGPAKPTGPSPAAPGGARSALAVAAGPADSSAFRAVPGAPRRISFHIRTLHGPSGAYATASDATVEGPPDTDLSLHSRTGAFELVARLKTDLVAAGRLRIVADLTTRRRAGTSRRGLPLYEEDVRREIVTLAADGTESLALLPFGRNPGGEELALDVLPRLTEKPLRDRNGQLLSPEIRIAEVGPEGWLKIEATRSLHHFRVEAALERAGESVARGAGRCELGESCDVGLAGRAGAGQGDLARLRLTVGRSIPTCPAPQVEIDFDLLRVAPHAGSPRRASGGIGLGQGGGSDAGAAILRRDSGIGPAGSPFVYPLGERGAGLAGQPDTLKLTIVPEDLE